MRATGWCVLLVVACGRSLAAGPSMFLSAPEIAEIRTLVAKGRNPWAVCAAALLDDATRALSARPSPVAGTFTYVSPLQLFGEPVSGEPTDEDLARRDSHTTRDLGLAYAITGDEVFAERAAEFVAAWATTMDPVYPFDERNLGPMAVNTTLPAMFYGYDLIAGSRARTAELEAVVGRWAGALADGCKAHHFSADRTTTAWNMTFILASTIAAGRQDGHDFVYGKTRNPDTFQSLVPALFRSNGEADAGDNLRFQGEGIYIGLRMVKSFTYVAEVARHRGVDLYNWEGNRRGLRKCFSYYAPYFNGTLHLPGVGGFPLGRDADACIFEIANAIWPDREFERVLEYLGRPGYDPDILGPMGLTHRYRGE